MFSFLLELVGIASIAGGVYAKIGPEGYWKNLSRRLGCDAAGALEDYRKK